MCRVFFPFLISLCLVGSSLGQSTERFIEGPLTAEIIEIIDGDTIEVLVRPWLGTTITTRIRLRGIDTAEINRASCAIEAGLGTQAQDFLTQMLLGERARPYIQIVNISPDKYAGRVVADIYSSDGQNVSEALLASGLAKPYHGGTRPDWCT